MQPGDLNNLISGGAGAIAVLAFFVGLFIRGDIVARIHYDDLIRERDAWRGAARTRYGFRLSDDDNDLPGTGRPRRGIDQ